MKHALEKSLCAPRNGLAATVATLGQGWVAEEALAIAVYAGLCAVNLDHGLSIALKHGGDSDSTGAIAGNLLAVVFPGTVMEHPLIESVECADLIEKIVRELWADILTRAAA
ncbi:ADP-ribosylglycohydrolase family protein [Falsigemmobacter intermedius]|uniref:ADP-ribosylglycohydrolase family protein n=1 Tax=Falsigemmobacter intermedius TaxID=1553448 RepID=UPI0019D47D1F